MKLIKLFSYARSATDIVELQPGDEVPKEFEAAALAANAVDRGQSERKPNRTKKSKK